jgi:tetratricopeptide (TPR) repeat protein
MTLPPSFGRSRAWRTYSKAVRISRGRIWRSLEYEDYTTLFAVWSAREILPVSRRLAPMATLVVPSMKTPSLLGLALTIARTAAGWNGKQLAQAAQIASSTLSLYESGKLTLTRERFKELVAVMRPEPDFADRALLAAALVTPTYEVPPTLTERDVQTVSKASIVAGIETVDLIQTRLTTSIQSERVKKAHEQAATLWERLKKYSVEERRILVEGATDYHEWALCVRLCRESERAATRSTAEALALAELALLVAQNLPGPERWRFRFVGQAWLFIGNAKRVANKLILADQAFTRGWQFWSTGEDSSGILDEGYLLDLEASLRRDERRFQEALMLHERALALAKSEHTGAILLNKAFTLKIRGDFEASIEVLLAARAAIDPDREPRLLTVLLFNLAANYVQLGKAVEARSLLREVHARTQASGATLDLIRALWLEGQCAALEGDHPKAITLFNQVRQEFRERKLPYYCALVTLDLALLYRRTGALREMQRLAAEMLTVFEEHGIHREATAAVTLFQEAAQGKRISIESLECLQISLGQTRLQPHPGNRAMS